MAHAGVTGRRSADRLLGRSKQQQYCCGCRFYADSDGALAGGLGGSGYCRRYPPAMVETNLHLSLAHENRAQFGDRVPYIPDHAWAPKPMFPVVGGLDWCGEWASIRDCDRLRSDAIDLRASQRDANRASQSLKHG
jgi:hypothetical protein